LIGWLRLLRGALVGAARGYGRHGASQQASAIAFRVLFALVPLTALTVAIADLVLPEGRREEVVEWVIDRLSGSTGLEDSVRRAVSQGSAGASAAGIVALVTLVWAASGMMSAIRRAFQTIWEDVTPRSFARGKAVDLVVVLGTGLVAIVAFGLGIAVNALSEAADRIAETIGVGGVGLRGTALAAASTLALIFACFAALYRFVSPGAPRWEAVWPGALVGAVGFQAATTVYGTYLARFGDLSVVYGSLGAVLGFLLVVWVGSVAMLVGAEVVAGWPASRTSAGERLDERRA
jgi:membrane protein